ncbi:hypothetical protein [Actinomadura sp. WMMB 499]|uniref:hypothetical protein n=1 Tax=Actinomadura sp. WMMB 499 TaxID=1219491 RepID=UPI0012468BF1|nr:hypothetical protein [Actinomadura sp. WMMB 499]QFG22842.1 hypothetical protein F7P10_18705 [Actinomadura sp. WMMB 499]
MAGAHGGAGTSTLAALLPAAWDMGAVAAMPDADRCPVQAKGRPVLLAVRNTAAAARCATAAIAVLRQGGEGVAGLAIVSDGGPEPRDATARFALLEWQVGGVVRVPYVRALRLVEDPAEVALPAKAQQALEELRRLVTADGRGWRR